MASDKISSDMVEVSEFQQLAMKYNVRGVPHTVINESHNVVGAVPAPDLARAVLQALGK